MVKVISAHRDRHQQTVGPGPPVRSRLEHMPELVAKARQVNDRLLMIECAGQGCAIGPALFERIHQPYARRANGPERSGLEMYAPWPWPAHCAVLHTPSPASATKAFAGMSPGSSAPTTALTR